MSEIDRKKIFLAAGFCIEYLVALASLIAVDKSNCPLELFYVWCLGAAVSLFIFKAYCSRVHRVTTFRLAVWDALTEKTKNLEEVLADYSKAVDDLDRIKENARELRTAVDYFKDRVSFCRQVLSLRPLEVSEWYSPKFVEYVAPLLDEKYI